MPSRWLDGMGWDGMRKDASVCLYVCNVSMSYFQVDSQGLNGSFFIISC